MGSDGFEEMEAIFGQVKVEEKEKEKSEWSKPFLFHVHGVRNDRYVLAIRATDFHSNTWQTLKSVHQLEDLRDMIGIGGAWSDFVEYVIASLKSEDVKLVLEGQDESGGAASAKIIAQKAKGMPRISISLTKLVDAAASEAMANISLELFKLHEKTRKLLVKEQERCCQVTKILEAERKKSESIQRELDNALFTKRQKLFDKPTSDVTQESSDKQATKTTVSSKISNRVVPAHRRAKARGAYIMHSDVEED